MSHPLKAHKNATELDFQYLSEFKMNQQKARNRVQLKVIETVLMEDLKNRIYEDINPDPSFKQYADRYNALQDQQDLKSHGRNAKWLFYTINPQEDNLDALIRLMESIEETEWCTNYIYSYEQRSEEPGKYYGYHIHLLFERPSDTYPSDIKKCLISKLKHSDVKGNWNNKNPCQRNVKSEEDYYKVLQYILGHKKDEKQEKVQNDQLFRNEEGLKQYYTDLNALLQEELQEIPPLQLPKI